MFPQPGNNDHRVVMAVALNKLLEEVLLPTARAVAPGVAVEFACEWREVDRGGTPCLSLNVDYTIAGGTKAWLQSNAFEVKDERDFQNVVNAIYVPTATRLAELLHEGLDQLKKSG